MSFIFFYRLLLTQFVNVKKTLYFIKRSKTFAIQCSAQRVILILLVILYTPLLAKQNDTIFFKIIEQKVRLDYQNCTGDYSEQTLRKLILWKESIDSIVQRKDYPQILKTFFEDTTNSNSKNTPCEVVAWYQRKNYEKKMNDSITKVNAVKNERIKSDSIFAKKELDAVKHSSIDLYNIPFGVSHRSVVKLLKDKGISNFQDDTLVIHFEDSTDSLFFVKALFFNKYGTYYKYETETRLKSADSLDNNIRPLLKSIETIYQNKLTELPLHSNYIGFTDIAEGKLAISKEWTQSDLKIYTGLSMYKQKYYAKVVIIKSTLNLNSNKK